MKERRLRCSFVTVLSGNPAAVRLAWCGLLVVLLVAPVETCLGQIGAQPPVSSSTHQDGAAARPTSSDAVPSAIPLPQIANRAEELERQLREVIAQMTPKTELVEAARAAELQGKELDERAVQVDDLLAGTPTGLELQEEQRYWRRRSLDSASQRNQLTTRAAQIESQIQFLDTQLLTWQATWDQSKGSEGIEPVLDRVRRQLEAIRAARSQAREQLNQVLTIQNQVSQQDQMIADVVLRIAQARDRQRGRLLARDSAPLWKVREQRVLETEDHVIPHLSRSFDRAVTEGEDFLELHGRLAAGFALSYVLALIAARKLRRHVVSRAATGTPQEAVQVFALPYSVALLFALFVVAPYMLLAPYGIAVIFYLIYLVPVLRLLPALLAPQWRNLLYTLAAFFILEGLHVLLQFPPLLRREFFALLTLAALVSFSWLSLPSRLGRVRNHQQKLTSMIVAVRAGLVLLGCSLLANILGFVALAHVLGLAVLLGAFAGAALYCALRVLLLTASTFLHTAWAQSVLQLPTDATLHWASRALNIAARVFWLAIVLRLLTVYEKVMTAIAGVLQYSIGYDKVHFTLGGALNVLVVMALGFLLANVVTFLLKRVVLPRLHLKRGVPYAISTITYYALLVLVAVAALSDAGVELNKFTVLTGALGVGLGFGLQNIVNNFVSGVILLFEHPIHLGDVIDVGGLVGTVRWIGARSVTILTGEGAEVIVPNSNLLSNQVINWTLSSPSRRVDVNVRVANGTDPEQVVKLLVEAAKSHPGVLHERPPEAFFFGYGESAMNFELRFWSARQETWFQLQSDVSVAVSKALKDAGIETPYPQRDLHIRSVDAGIEKTLATKGQPGPPSARQAGARG